MKSSVVALVASVLVGIAITLACAQEGSETANPNSGSKTLGTVVSGNTTIEFQAARSDPAEIERLKTWSAFAKDHPEIARDLGNKPTLIGDPDYLKAHTDLGAFLSKHPEIGDEFSANPGNFVVGRGTAH